MSHEQDFGKSIRELRKCKNCRYWAVLLPPEAREKARLDERSGHLCELFGRDGFCPNDYCSKWEAREEDVMRAIKAMEGVIEVFKKESRLCRAKLKAEEENEKMKVEKQADGSEVHVLERRPWREEMPQKPCYECGKMIYRDGDYWEIKCCTRLGRLLCRIAQWIEHVRWDREERKQYKICSNCSEYAEWYDKMAKWNENWEYWASRAGMVAASTPEAEETNETNT